MSNEITAVETLTIKIDNALNIFTDVDQLAENLQPVLVDVLVACKAINHKKTVKESPDVRRLFERQYRGLDRAKLVAWFEQFSPLRIRFDTDTGRFKSIAWCSDKDGQPDQWDIEGAKDCDWWTAKGKAKAKNAKVGEVAAAQKSLAKIVARKVYAEHGAVNPADVDATIEKMQADFFTLVRAQVTAYVEDSSFDKWTEAFDSKAHAEDKAKREKAKAEQAKADKIKAEDLARAEKAAKDAQEEIARLQAELARVSLVVMGSVPAPFNEVHKRENAQAAKGRKRENAQAVTH